MTSALDRELVVRAFRLIAVELERAGVRGEVLIAGGAVMALEYDATRVTRDVDGLVTAEHGAVMRAAEQVAARLHLPRGWLNEGVSVYLSTQPDPGRHQVFDHPNLAVLAVSEQHLIALKARAARAQDLADLHVLARTAGLTTAEEVVAIVATFFPDDPLSPRARAAIEDLFPDTST